MSKQVPECPLYRPTNCKYYGLKDVCALVRSDKVCKKDELKPKKLTTEQKKNRPDEKKLNLKCSPLKSPV